ncbi:hypothetical protein AB0G42_21490 [Streptomyces yangpuensis]|uniref:hypothetical protein n=1 Tax=Streptomyces yangpuensis TaxID=1648182 RepID=UPI0034454022
MSSEALEGIRSMRLTATAAGSVEAVSPRFTVAAGKTYVARLPIRQSTSTAKTVTGRITWYDAASGGSVISFVDFSLTTNATVGWSAANYVVASGVAPAGALSATAAITVAGLSAGEFVNTDDVYAAEVPRRANDLLEYNTGSCENDTTGWAITGGTRSRVAGVLYAGAGYYVMAVTSSGAGQVSARTATRYPITPGTTYVAYAAVQGTATALSGHFAIEWYDAGDVWMSTSTVSETFDTTIRRMAISATAPAGAAKARVMVRPVATGAGQIIYVDDVSLCPAPNRPGNILTYEEYSSESTFPAWTLPGETLERVYMTSGITDGFYALSFAPVAHKIHRMSLDRLLPVTAGTTYQAKATYFGHNPSATEATQMTYRVFMDWYDSAGLLLLADNPDGFYSMNINPNGLSGTTSTETRTAPEGAAFARLIIELDHSNSNVDRYYIDGLSLLEASPEYELVSDNATGAVRLTVHLLVPGAPRIHIQRVDQDGRKAYVRGYGQEYKLYPYAGTTMVIEDYEAPLGTRVWYSIRWTNDAGTFRYNSLDTQAIAAPVLENPDYVWFKSPGNPALNTRVLMESPLKWSRVARSTSFTVVGRKNPIHKSDVRSGRTANVTALIWDPSANALFDSLLDTGLPVLIQAMPGYGVEGNLYLAIQDSEVEHLDPDARVPGWRWSLPVVEIDRPDGGLQGSAVSTWQDIYDDYTSWEELFDAHATWITVLTKG